MVRTVKPAVVSRGARSRAAERISVGTLVLLCLVLMHPVGVGAETALLRQDFQALISPVNLGLGALSIGVAGIAHRWDDQLRGEVGKNAVLRGALDLGNVYGSNTYGVSTTLGLWSLAKLTHRPQLQAVSSELLRALVLANVLVTPVKFVVGRERPDGSNNLSFPSGHAANAFAMTAVLSRRYGRGAGIPLYGFAALVPVARIHHQRHFFSDVIGGALLGTIAGCVVTRQQEEGELTWAPAYTSSGWLLQTQWRL